MADQLALNTKQTCSSSVTQPDSLTRQRWRRWRKAGYIWTWEGASLLRQFLNFSMIKKKAREDLTSKGKVWFIIVQLNDFITSYFCNFSFFFSSNIIESQNGWICVGRDLKIDLVSTYLASIWSVLVGKHVKIWESQSVSSHLLKPQ